jgi:beta-mannosidase
MGAWGATASMPVSVPAGASNFTVTLPAANNTVKLWWPAQTPGAQNLYNVTTTFTPAAGGAPVIAARRIGFRIFTLVTGNDTDPSTLAGKDGSGGFTMRVKVNGADVWARGANVIPMEELEGRLSDAAHRRLVQSAADAGFNTLRVWGGGIWQLDAFYDAASELGMLLYHDAMYAGYFAGSHTPAVTLTQDAELRHQIRRLAEHPSVAIYDGCKCGQWLIHRATIARSTHKHPPSPPTSIHRPPSSVSAIFRVYLS